MTDAARDRRGLERWTVLLEFLDRWSLRLVVLALVVSYLALFHVFFRAGQHAPYLAVDDSLGNVAVGLSNLHRYGFLASPFQGADAVRLHGFYNYGPWPFLFGAVLDWVFGTSYLVQRAIHPLGLMVLSFLAFWSLRRSSAAAAGCFSLIVIWLFWAAQWPEVRPGITVAVFAGFAIVLLGRAMRTGRSAAWFGAGFCAASAAATHQIAWALVPAAALVWLLSQWEASRRAGWRGSQRTFGAMAAGGVLSAVIYLFAIRFRILDLLHLMLHYARWARTRSSASFPEVLEKHFFAAWHAGTVGHEVRYLSVLLVFCAVALFVALRTRHVSTRRLMLSLLVPPVIFAAAYQLSLGFYNNFITSYTLVSQVTTAWVIAAILAVLNVGASAWLPAFTRAGEVALRFCLVAGLFVLATYSLAVPRGWAAPSVRQVNYSTYLTHVSDIVPLHARAWGSVIFGLDSGVRIDLVQFGDALALAGHFKPTTRAHLAPDFLLLNDILQAETYDRVAHLGQSYLTAFMQEFPGLDYRVVGITYAPPYGTTEVYARHAVHSVVGGFPVVAFNDGRHPSWAERIGATVDVRWTTAPPVHFKVRYFVRSATGSADRSIRGKLAAGLYLIGVKVKTDARQGGLLIGTNSTEYVGRASGPGFNLAQAVYFHSGDVAYLLVDHDHAGPLYISQFDADPVASMRVVGVNRVPTEATAVTMRWARLTIPAPAYWHVADRGVSLGPRGQDGAVLVRGNGTRFGYQFGSPAIRVRPGDEYRVQLPLRVFAGEVAVGVLNAARTKWLAAPNSAATHAATHVDFNAGTNREVYVMVCNNRRSIGSQRSRFEVGQASLWKVGSAEQYADQLAACTGRSARRRPEMCQ